MDRRLAETSWYASAFDQSSRESDMPFFHEDERDSRIAEACDACASGLWRSGCAEIFFPAGQDDLSPEAVLPPADLLVQRAVRNMPLPCREQRPAPGAHAVGRNGADRPCRRSPPWTSPRG